MQYKPFQILIVCKIEYFNVCCSFLNSYVYISLTLSVYKPSYAYLCMTMNECLYANDRENVQVDIKLEMM